MSLYTLECSSEDYLLDFSSSFSLVDLTQASFLFLPVAPFLWGTATGVPADTPLTTRVGSPVISVEPWSIINRRR